MYAVQGDNFWNGFAAGSISSLAASAWSGGSSFETTGNVTTETVHRGIGEILGMGGSGGMIAFGTIAGGAGAALTGGNFWQGAVTGLIVSGLNHFAHDEMNKTKDKVTFRKWRTESDGTVSSENLVFF